MNGAVLFGVLLALTVMIGFVALWRLTATRDPVEQRLQQYGVSAELEIGAAASAVGGQRSVHAGMSKMLAGLGVGPSLAASLSRADMPLTAAEFAIIVLGASTLGFIIGEVRGGLLLALPLALLGGSIPVIYMRMRQKRRVSALTEQLPDVLTMLIGALRTGYGLPQAIEILVSQMPPPTSVEFQRVIRAVGVGQPLQRAMSDMVERVGSDDLALVVTAISVQYELGGNLAQTLETIAETVRDRIRIKRAIRVFTSQQRFTGYVLAALPIGAAVILLMVSPDYIRPLFAPGGMRVIPAIAIVLQVVGFLAIRKIVDIEV